MNDEIARLVLSRSEAREIQRMAIGDGMHTMFGDGLAKAQSGLTTIEEVLRATREV
jgi:general secretion pathway protein E